MNVLAYNKLNDVASVVDGLQQLLADFQVFYTNLRGFHWNIKGHGFFQLHAQFERYYDDVAEKADELAERILQLGGTPANRFSDYLRVARVAEVSGVADGAVAVQHVLDTFSHLLDAERALLRVADEAGDETTVALLSDYIRQQEKAVWMLVAFSSREQ